MKKNNITNQTKLAYIIGVAIGDGNLSNPNGRATRLRITCDLKYPQIISEIKDVISYLLPQNKVSIINRTKRYCDISCYSNKWEKILGWQANNGPKYQQKIKIPQWIKNNKNYTSACLKGLLQTDGSIYQDRGYTMVNFTTIMPTLSKDVLDMIKSLNYTANIYTIQPKNNQTRFTIRISKDVKKFINTIELTKE